MPYTPTTWVNGTTAVSQAAMNNLDGPQYTEAVNSFTSDLLTAFVLSGGVCSIHGGLPKQLDFTQIRALLIQTDGTYRWRTAAAGNFTSSVASTTYFLDLNPDGTMSWGTAHSGQANYLPICSVTTDGSQNLVLISDARQLNTALLAALSGALQWPGTAFSPVSNNTSPIFYSRDSGGTVHQGVKINAQDGFTQVTGYDTSASATRAIRTFIGTSDPAGVTTINEGDLWLNV